MRSILGVFGVLWGISGFCLLIFNAIYRLSSRIFEVNFSTLTLIQYAFLLFFSIFMLISEGWSGFHKQLCPRFAARSKFLATNPSIFSVALAPFFCVGYFAATKKRIMISWGLTTFIVLAVVLVAHVPQPWRGIIDLGVVLGLSLGIVSLIYNCFQVLVLNREAVDPEFSKP